MKKILLILILFVTSFKSNSQSLILDKGYIETNGIKTLTFYDYNPLEPDYFNESQELKTKLIFDEAGYLIKSEKLLIENEDTISNELTIFIYREDNIFLTVTKEFVLSEYRQINVWDKDSTCLPNIIFKIYETDTTTNYSVFKKYESDDDLNFYFDYIFFDRTIMTEGMEMYMREMEWLELSQNIYHIDSLMSKRFLNEIFITYSFTSESFEEIEEETGEVKKKYLKGLYSYDESDYFDERRFLQKEVQTVSLSRSQFNIATEKKRIKRAISKNDTLIINLPEFVLKLRFENKKAHNKK